MALGDVRAVEPLLQSLRDEYEWVRSNAAWALGALGEPRAAEPLRDIVANDSDERTRTNAAVALGELGDIDSVPLLASLLAVENPRDIRLSALVALGTLAVASDEVLEGVIGSLTDPDDEIRATSAWALGRFAHEAALEPLIRALHDPYEWVRSYAVESLALIGGDRAKQALGLLLLSIPEDDPKQERMLAIVTRALEIATGEDPGPIFG